MDLSKLAMMELGVAGASADDEDSADSASVFSSKK